MLLAVHWLLDYPLQGDFLSKATQSGPLRVYHLIAHSGIQGAGVGLVNGNVWLGLVEWLAHTIIDEAAVRGGTTFVQDQASHIACRPSGSPTSSCPQRCCMDRLSRLGGVDFRSGRSPGMVASLTLLKGAGTPT